MPWGWLRALKHADGTRFLADGLSRYGYLPNPKSPLALPVGFTVSAGARPYVGMTCAACHTRQLDVGGDSYRIDGGPALVDFQAFLTDIDDSVIAALASDAAFLDFATQVYGHAPSDREITELRADAASWSARTHLIISLSLSGLTGTSAWGVGRADAVQMIFNRLTGLGIGTPPNHVIAGNIQKADAPVRYPFLWNAPWETKTQWMAFAPNGNDISAMLRNMGQDIGVFSDFFPNKDTLLINYWPPNGNSMNVGNLNQIEGLVKQMDKPKWPWAYDKGLASAGRKIHLGKGECSGCHGDPGQAVRTLHTTQVFAVGTDTRQFRLLTRPAESGVIDGDLLFLSRLKPTDTALNVFTHAVGNTYLQSFFHGPSPAATLGFAADLAAPQRDLVVQRSMDLVDQASAANAPGYEARRLEGVWAAAPYLHNGSVATLADLLEPAANRAPDFLVGPEFDPKSVGLAKSQPRFSSRTVTTLDCGNPVSGNSRCGHEYPRKKPLTGPEKAALLEYLKTL